MEDKAEFVEFMNKFSFATIITSNNNIPTASQLPFVIQEKENQVILLSHFAKANEQWKYLTENQCLVLFSEPHAYVSPSHYEKVQNVPTWNYISVQAYGNASIIEGKNESLEVLELMIRTFEESYKAQWDSLPADYKERMLNGIVPFKISVTNLQGKKKISQNRSAIEQERLIMAFSKGNGNEQEIAKYMRKNSK
jgi:transcriptional regulator